MYDVCLSSFTEMKIASIDDDDGDELHSKVLCEITFVVLTLHHELDGSAEITLV